MFLLVQEIQEKTRSDGKVVSDYVYIYISTCNIAGNGPRDNKLDVEKIFEIMFLKDGYGLE